MEEAATASEASPRDDVIVHPSRHATTTMLFKAVRKWVSQRQGKEFTFIDIEDEPSISDLAIELVSQDADVHPVHVSARALRMIAGTVQDLIQHGSIEIRDKDRMVLRARARGETLSKVETEVIDLDQETWVQRVSKQEVIDLERATSENLPAGSEDLALNLEICDQIRSKQVPPKEAAQALKKRIGHKNPNVQLLALGLTDVCVKNGGHHFLVEVANREFIDNLTSILKAPAGSNFEVKNKILALIQTWGLLFRGKHGLGYVCDTYMILQHEGFPFPPAENIGAALVESEAPPDWTDSDVCTRCRNAFTLTNRKHHCRACGSTFCGDCSSKTMALPNLGVMQEVRVCDGCWMKKKLGTKSAVALESHGLGGGLEVVPSAHKQYSSSTSSAVHKTNGSTSNGTKSVSKPSASQEDEDLKRAIELSIKEANNTPGYSAPSTKRTEPTAQKPTPTDEEEDADLLAAIEASLRETSIHSSFSLSAPTRSSQKQSSYSSYSYNKKPVAAVVAPSPNELSETEKSNIEMFATLVDRIQMMQGDVAGNREIQALYEQISKLQMKVALNLEEVSRKQQEFIGFNEKIDHAVRMYDHLLQERLNSSYQRRMNSTGYGNYGQTGNFQQSIGTPHLYNTQAIPQTPVQSNVYPHMSGPDPRYGQYVPAVAPQATGSSQYGATTNQQPHPQQVAYQPYQPQLPQQTPQLQSQQLQPGTLPAQQQPGQQPQQQFAPQQQQQQQQQQQYQYQIPQASEGLSYVTPLPAGSGQGYSNLQQTQPLSAPIQVSSVSDSSQMQPQQQFSTQAQQQLQPQQQNQVATGAVATTMSPATAPGSTNGPPVLMNQYQPGVQEQPMQSPHQPNAGTYDQQSQLQPQQQQSQQQQPQQQQPQQQQYQTFQPQQQPQEQMYSQSYAPVMSTAPPPPKIEEAPLIEL
ncbi:Vacuolar protein-sorting-associated protein 27 [Podila humilis]|nr:Vacuolar protein-sorting-associated protein 27 [Podila humilis]